MRKSVVYSKSGRLGALSNRGSNDHLNMKLKEKTIYKFKDNRIYDKRITYKPNKQIVKMNSPIKLNLSL